MPWWCQRASVRRRFACPYHNWTYDTRGDLVGITDREWFGDVDAERLGLTPLPVAERAGLVFVVLTPGAAMDIDAHLCGYDGYLDFYHLPFLHRSTFGPDIGNKPIYYEWGPHQRMTSPDPALLERVVRDEDYFTGLRRQRALATGAKEHVLFGRNEGGGQRFHTLLDRYVGDLPVKVTRKLVSPRSMKLGK